MARALLVDDCFAYPSRRRFWPGSSLSLPRGCVMETVMLMAVQNTVHKDKRRTTSTSVCFHPPCLQIDSSLTSRHPASSKLETEP